MANVLYAYYESGEEERYSLYDLIEFFSHSQPLQEEALLGTTFESWLEEMIRMQILTPID